MFNKSIGISTQMSRNVEKGLNLTEAASVRGYCKQNSEIETKDLFK